MALLAMVAVFVMAFSAYTLHALNNSSAQKVAQRNHDAAVLKQAKEALIGYLALRALEADEAHPGRLPCPESVNSIGDASDEGTASSNCTLPAAGRLPWKTLGLEQLKDSSGEPLWYVVSSGWANYSGTTLVLNSNVPGYLSIDGQANAAVALIFAPGPALTVQASANCTARTQARSTTSLNVRDYLECENASPSTGAFATTGPSSSFNDTLVSVTAKEVWTVVEPSVARRIKSDLVPQLQAAAYSGTTWSASGSGPIFPFPARFSNDAGTFNPESFQGRRFSNDANTVAHTQGLLPVSAATCTTITNGRCDADFVKLNVAGISITKTSGGASPSVSSTCASSTNTQLQCVITLTCTGFCLGSAAMKIVASVQNVGMSFRSFSGLTTSLVSGFTSGTAISSAGLASDGSYSVDVRGNIGYFCSFSGCSRNATVTFPLSFTDAAFLSPASEDAWYWFFQNEWHKLTYYAVSSSHVASGTSPFKCNLAGTCITVNVSGGSTESGNQAVLFLAGRSLSGTSRPNGSLSDFLDSVENRDGNATLEQKRPSSDFNDRYIASLGTN